MRHLDNQRGATLLELIMASMMMGFLALVITEFYTQNLVNYARNESQIILQSNTKQAVESISAVIRSATAVQATNNVTDANKPGGWTSNANTLVLATPALDASKNPIYVDASHTAVWANDTIYYIKDNVLYRRILKNSSAPGNAAVTTCPPESATGPCPADAKVVEDVASLTVDYGGPIADAESLKITLTQSRARFGRTYISTLTARSTLRN